MRFLWNICNPLWRNGKCIYLSFSLFMNAAFFLFRFTRKVNVKWNKKVVNWTHTDWNSYHPMGSRQRWNGAFNYIKRLNQISVSMTVTLCSFFSFSHPLLFALRSLCAWFSESRFPSFLCSNVVFILPSRL